MLAELLKISAFLALFLLHSSILGAALLPPTLHRPTRHGLPNGFLLWFFILCLGTLGNIAVLFVLGVAGQLKLPSVLAAGGILLPLSALRALPLLRALAGRRGAASKPDLTAVASLGLIFLLSVIVALHPPGHFDDTMYQLPLARHYLEHQRIALHEYLRFPLFPQNINLLFVLGLMLDGVLLAQGFASLPLFIIAVGLVGASIWMLGTSTVGIFAGALLFIIGPIKRTLGFAYVDNGLAMFCWAATLAFLLFDNERQQRKTALYWAALAGLMAGAAAGSKYFGVVLAALIGTLLLLWRRDWRATLVYSACLIATGCWWYVRSYLISGDPIHPAGGQVFGHYLWDAGDLALQAQEQDSHGVGRNPLHIAQALKEAHVLPWLGALLGVALLKVPTQLRRLQLIFILYLAFWFFVTQVSRYLAPVFAAGCFLTVYTAYRWLAWLPTQRWLPDRRQRRIAVAAFVLLLLLGFTIERFQRYEGRMKQWDALLEQTPGYSLFTHADKLKPQYGSRLVQLGFESATYWFDGLVIGDVFGRGRYRDMLICEQGRCRPVPQHLFRYLESNNAYMLAISTRQYANLDLTAFERAGFQILMQDNQGVLFGINRR